MSSLYLADRQLVSDAAALIHRFGTYAADEAARRADRSRTVGNVIHFCRWRQVERLVRVLATDQRLGTLH
ncbi:hypothetical protein CA236_01755 [Sphingomonas sp. ABOLG]|uniref:Uncharacterized protein n=1 Tax=Sphingomonas olei TaxID=1886787 RepID=A0ABY2QKG2_9SPHN|nr:MULTISPECIES: hypothetical protein [Sphingomonas]KKI19107.1 hypothetical protein XM50_10205 [Sphingomonas sp. Ag1]RSV20631.1 hypothetical protein CA236_01755 [Sphingomonas sp. ABOLG]THG41458.1 hypothetical protein E5988_02740 [Sphingomonas olei]